MKVQQVSAGNATDENPSAKIVQPVTIHSSAGMADPVWEESVYGGGKFVRCPYDQVATFVFRNLPQKPRHKIRILELGCGPGNNLAFLASEGFACYGFDSSARAIEYAKARCGAAVELKVAGFPDVPFEGPFDLVIERAALSYVPLEIATKTIARVRELLTPRGRFMFTPYSEQEERIGYCCYYTAAMIREMFRDWKILQLQHVTWSDEIRHLTVTAEYRVWVEAA